AVIDERFNGGGLLAEYIIDYLRRPLMNYISSRDGQDQVFPATAIYGPKVMIINQMAGSGGDAMPYYFRQQKVGKLIGKRTWGGLVGIGGYPTPPHGGEGAPPPTAHLVPAREGGGGERRGRPRHRRGNGPGRLAGGPRPATGEGSCRGPGGVKEAKRPQAEAAGVSELSPEEGFGKRAAGEEVTDRRATSGSCRSGWRS